MIDVTIHNVVVPVAEIRWESNNGTKASTLTCSFLNVDFFPKTGQMISMTNDEQICFVGYVFEVSYDEKQCTVHAYDQIRYLMFKDSYVFSQKTVDEIINAIAQDMGIKIGNIETGKYRMDLVVEDKKLLDTIQQAIQIEKEQTGQLFFLTDNEGKLELVNQANLKYSTLLSDDSQLTAFQKKESIDTDTFNRVKLAQKSRKKAVRITSIAQDVSSIGQWGTLQYYKRVDEKLTEAQVEAMAQQILQQKSNETRQWILQAVGDSGCKAGYRIAMQVQNENCEGVIERAIHQWKAAEYTMVLYIDRIEFN